MRENLFVHLSNRRCSTRPRRSCQRVYRDVWNDCSSLQFPCSPSGSGDINELVYALKFFPNREDRLGAVCEDGSFVVIDTSSVLDGDVDIEDGSRWGSRVCPLVASYGTMDNAYFDFELTSSSNVVCASGSSHLIAMDVNTGDVVRKFSSGHKGSVRVVTSHNSNPHIFFSGGRDGSICLWDDRSGESRPLRILWNAHVPDAENSPRDRTRKHRSRRRSSSVLHSSSPCAVTGLCVGIDDRSVYSSSSRDSSVLLWDIRTLGSHRPLCSICPEFSGADRGISSLVLSPETQRLSFSCIGQRIYSIPLSAFHASGISTGLSFSGSHSCSSFFVKLASDPLGKCVLSGSSSGDPVLYSLDRHYPSDIGRCGVQESIGVCFSSSGRLVAASNGTGTFYVWKMERPVSVSPQNTDLETLAPCTTEVPLLRFDSFPVKSSSHSSTPSEKSTGLQNKSLDSFLSTSTSISVDCSDSSPERSLACSSLCVSPVDEEEDSVGYVSPSPPRKRTSVVRTRRVTKLGSIETEKSRFRQTNLFFPCVQDT